MDKDNNSIYTVLTEEIKKENSSTIKAKLLYILNNKALDEAEWLVTTNHVSAEDAVENIKQTIDAALAVKEV